MARCGGDREVETLRCRRYTTLNNAGASAELLAYASMFAASQFETPCCYGYRIIETFTAPKLDVIYSCSRLICGRNTRKVTNEANSLNLKCTLFPSL